MVWGLVATLFFPLVLLMYAEAGRYGARGLVRWPILVFALGQLLGISVAFPSLWLPFALTCRGSSCTVKGRVWMAMLVALIVTMLEAYVFFGDTHGKTWTFCAGLLVGPGIPFLGVLLWPFPASEKPDGAEGAIRTLVGEAA